MNLMRRFGLLCALGFCLAAPSGPATAGEPAGAVISMSTLATASPVSPVSWEAFESSNHEHQWVKKSERVWVPPKTKKVQVGTDKKGRPIYEERVVKKGEYKTVYIKVCNICGRKK